jgi:hypothetical protein
MDFEPRFRIHQKSRAGYEVFIIGHQFDNTGPIHYFNDHTHARNFCRYLFSLTGRHPTNALTQRNVVRSIRGDGRFQEDPLDTPQRQYDAFMRERFPARDADALLCDDGAYVGFAILTPEKRVISNLISQGTDMVLIELGMFEMLRADRSDAELVAGLVGRAETATFFEQQQVRDEHTLLADKIVQRLASHQMGGDPVLTVSHRDQLDHNQTYHIHRLLRMPN